MDPNLDPELALALRVSMEEERARQEAAAKKAAEEGGDAAPTASGAADAQPEPAAAAVVRFSGARIMVLYQIRIDLTLE